MNPRQSHRVVRSFLTILLLAVVAQAGPADPVYIPDTALKQAIKHELGIAHDPNEADMLRLTLLYSERRGITSLAGLQYATNLTRLWLVNNQISDLSPLSDLTYLYELDLFGNQINDLSPLTGLTKLGTLKLAGNPLDRDAYCQDLQAILNANPVLHKWYSYWETFSFSPNANPPGGVAASDGTYADKVQITWDALCPGPPIPIDNPNHPARDSVYFKQVVYRSDSLGGTKTAISGELSGNSFDDTTAVPGVHYYYWVQGVRYYCQFWAGDDRCGLNYTTDFSDADEGLTSLPQRTLVTSSTAGGTVSTPGIGPFQYDLGASVPVVATADPHYHFVNWTGTAVTGGDVADPTAASTTVRMHNDFTLVANFAIDKRTLTTSSTAGGDVTTPGEGTFTYDYYMSVPVVATADPHYHFVNWTGTAVTGGDVADPMSASTTVNMHTHFTLVANFAIDQRTLTVSSTTGGSVSPTVGSHPYDHGSSVAISATATSNYHFVNWTGTAVTAGKVGNPSSSSTTAMMDADYTLQANFAIDKRTLTTSSTAGGTVGTPGIGAFQYDHGTSASVEATPQANYHFVNWTGTAVTAGKVGNPSSSSTTVTMDADYTLQANFAIDRHTLTTSSNTGGDVTTPGEGIYTYDYGTTVNLAATPDAHYHFVHWTGPVADSSSPSTTVTITGDTTVAAAFAIDQHGLTATSDGNGSATGSGTYDWGSTVPITATANANYHFVNWTSTGSVMVADAASANTTVTINGDGIVTAHFAINQHTLTVSSDGNGSATGSGTYDWGSTVPITATANANYHFVNWTISGSVAVADASSANTTVTMNGDGSVTALFAIDQRTLTTSSTAGGTVSTPGVGVFQYDHGAAASVTAIAGLNYHFVNWTGTAVTAGKVADPTSAGTTVTMEADYTLQAHFEIDRHTLTVTSEGDGSATGSGTYDWGSTVPVVASPNANWHFVNWTGTGSVTIADPGSASTTILVQGDGIVTAHFALDPRSLTISSTAGGSIISPGEGTFRYKHGDKVMLQAQADPLFTFVGWRGGLTANMNLYTFTMNADYTIKAHFESVLDVLYVEDNAPGDPSPDDPNLSDPDENGTPEHPYDSIQEAIEVAKNGTKVLVRTGTYLETIDLLSKSIELNGLNIDDPNIVALPVIDGQGKDTVVRCTQGEDPNCILTGLVITGGRGRLAGGVLCVGCSPSIMNCLIVGNQATSLDGGGGGIYCQDSNAVFINCTVVDNYGGVQGAGMRFMDSYSVVSNSIVWGNNPAEILASGVIQPIITYSDMAGDWPDVGNLNADPLFAMPGYWADPADLTKVVAASDPAAVWVQGDYRLMSTAGRWDPAGKAWVEDAVSSPCIDAGDPVVLVGTEPQPNGGRINMGAYGGTSQASLSNK